MFKKYTCKPIILPGITTKILKRTQILIIEKKQLIKLHGQWLKNNIKNLVDGNQKQIGGVNINNERKIEVNYSFDREKLANFLARIASEIANGKIMIKGEEIEIPQKLDIEYEFKDKKGKSEIEIEMKWEGQYRGFNLKKISSEIKIFAPSKEIWDILIDFEKYPIWNPFIREIIGKPEEGKKIKVTIQLPNSKKKKFKPTITKVNPKQEIRWRSKWNISGLLDKEHIFKIKDQDQPTVWLIQEEYFKGLFSPFLSKSLENKTLTGFNKMNHAIKQKVENIKK